MRKTTIISGLTVLMLCVCNTPIQSEENDEEADDREIFNLGTITVNNGDIDINLCNEELFFNTDVAISIIFRVDYEIRADGALDTAQAVLRTGGITHVQRSTLSYVDSFLLYTQDICTPGIDFDLTFEGSYYQGDILISGAHKTVTIRMVDSSQNNPPPRPDRPSGDTNIKSDQHYFYNTHINSEPDGEQVTFRWDWGTSLGGWIGNFHTPADHEQSHCWDSDSLEFDVYTFDIYVQAKDILLDHSNELKSPWSEGLPVQLTKETVTLPQYPQKSIVDTQLQHINLMNFNNTINPQIIDIQLLAEQPVNNPT